ncbi:hypothetical protein [uncultured Mailhella sp.]|uniref:hypothetical protein n=1 Tax=uncultured Mailhella sp. TaxID=1981031 RepID=UPI0032083FD6
MNTSAKKFQFPNSLVIVFAMMILAAALTHVIPAGQYDLITGTKLLDPATYHAIPQQGVSPWGLVDAVFSGMARPVPSSCSPFSWAATFRCSSPATPWTPS